ncbi:hypothetical protein [Acinetobacter pecorum]|uniref:Uncharacterized protein n=1 Tax=Acinetobacter pecorum TaxID=2762215 RepID=A0ABR8VVH9_9GAMM|nr:hypothetical protein [Acinetobacter pecorum]MBD8008759.1 hypothetical protein [Acinetobacter pecorum]
MSILLVVMLLLAIFHYFYQTVVVKTNNDLYDADLDILNHELEIFEIKNAKSLNASEKEFLANTKAFVGHCPEIGKEVTVVEMIMDMADYKTSKDYEGSAQRMRALQIQNDKIWKINVEASRAMLKNMTLNAGIFLFVLSPLLVLILFYSFISGRKLSLEQSVERISSKHC